MITIRVIFKIKGDHRNNFLNHIRQEVQDTQSWKGCHRFGVFEDVTKPDTFILYEEWNTLEDFEAYKKSDFFKVSGDKVFPMMEGSHDTAYYTANELSQVC